MHRSTPLALTLVLALATNCNAIFGMDEPSPYPPDAATSAAGGATGGSSAAGAGGASGSCSDGIENNGEAGIDCGGPCPVHCLGEACAFGSDCASAYCADGVCCDAACDKVCMACTAQKKGVDTKNGTCGPVAAGTDPDDDCGSPLGDVCNGAGDNGAKCQCHDGVKNGTETNVDCGGSCAPCLGTCSDGTLNNQESDIDCGGPNCGPTCPEGKTCAAPTDCTSGVCYMAACCTPDPKPTTCAGKDCGNVTDNCGQSVACGPSTCLEATAPVCLANKCVACDPGSNQMCECTGLMICDASGNWGSCSNGADTQNDVNHCGASCSCCVPSCAAGGNQFQCACGQCYYAPTDCLGGNACCDDVVCAYNTCPDCQLNKSCLFTACQRANTCP